MICWLYRDTDRKQSQTRRVIAKAFVVYAVRLSSASSAAVDAVGSRVKCDPTMMMIMMAGMVMLMVMVMSGVNNMQHIDPEWAMGRITLWYKAMHCSSVNYQLIAGHSVDIDDVCGVRRRKTKSTPPAALFSASSASSSFVLSRCSPRLVWSKRNIRIVTSNSNSCSISVSCAPQNWERDKSK